MSARLEILRQSLAKKDALFARKLDDHFACVKEANGQPLNDKSNGQATLSKWEKQNQALSRLKQEIEKTNAAIDKEESKVARVEVENESMPIEILKLVEDGMLQQWRKHPSTFFVVGVDKARIVWDSEKKILAHRYVREITDRDQHKKFAGVFNALSNALKSKESTA